MSLNEKEIEARLAQIQRIFEADEKDAEKTEDDEKLENFVDDIKDKVEDEVDKQV